MLSEWQTGMTKLPPMAAAMISISEDAKEIQVFSHVQGHFPEMMSSA